MGVAKIRCHRFVSPELDEYRHCILLFTGEFHVDFEVYIFWSNRLSERLQLVGREIEEIFLVHPSGTRRGGDGRGR